MNAWHDVALGEETPEFFRAVIEIPIGSRVKYELDKPTGLLKVDRVLFSAVHYPANYGFLPRTYCDDNDPLDVLVLGQVEVVPLSILRSLGADSAAAVVTWTVAILVSYGGAALFATAQAVIFRRLTQWREGVPLS